MGQYIYQFPYGEEIIMNVFCTLFDSRYFSRGLAAYQSLKRNCQNFHLYIFAFDDLALKTLKSMNLENVTVISLSEFEDEELLSIKKNRSVAEYCWTCTPSVIRYILNNYKVGSCTYIDADLFFFSDPSVLYKEDENCSVIITEHRFSENYKRSIVNGIYNVQFMYFKNDKLGNEIVSWWRDRCNEWCYAKLEDGKMGDQKYLDDWTTRFNGVHVMRHTGGGVAPWNVQSFDYFMQNDKLMQKEKFNGNIEEVIFFHFHNLKLYREGFAKTIGYTLSKDIVNFIYKPYYKNLIDIENDLEINYADISGKCYATRDIDALTLKIILSKMNRGDYTGENIITADCDKIKLNFNISELFVFIRKICIKAFKKIIYISTNKK